jgi:hypothetical protein
MMIMNFLDNHVVMHDVLEAHRNLKSVEEFGGNGCTIGGILVDCAEQIAAFHASHFNDQDLLKSS